MGTSDRPARLQQDRWDEGRRELAGPPSPARSHRIAHGTLGIVYALAAITR